MSPRLGQRQCLQHLRGLGAQHGLQEEAGVGREQSQDLPAGAGHGQVHERSDDRHDGSEGEGGELQEQLLQERRAARQVPGRHWRHCGGGQ